MNLLKIILSLALFFNISFAFAWVVDHFDVSFNKSEAQVWEALDLTIKAVDENWEVVKDYLWTIIWFSDTDENVELPEALTSDSWYTFTAANEWVMKFENGVIFHTPWEQKLWIYDTDTNENIIWEAKILIKKQEKQENVDIQILSPEDWLTIWENHIKVSWKTVKNHKVRIKLNDKTSFDTISNNDWIFEKEISPLDTWDNTIQAFTLDAEEKVIWTSKKITIKVDDNKPKFKKITLAPLNDKWEVEEQKKVIVNLYATPKLKNVSIIVNDQVIKLEETDDWVYSWNFIAPKPGTYKITAILKDDLGHSETFKDIATFTTTKKIVLNSAPTTNTWNTQKVEVNTWKIDKCKNLNLNVSGLKVVELKNKSVLTWNKVKDADYYKVFKQDWDKLVEVAKTKKEIFEINLTWKKVKYDYFQVQAFKECPEVEWSWTYIKNWDLSEATKVKTGPELILLLILSIILWAWFMFFRNKQV